MFPKHGDIRGGERWDRLSAAWVPAEEWQRRQWAREDAAFARKANQGELCTPSVIGDSMKTLQSQASGKWYDSKSNLRREYRQLGMQEVGNEKLTRRPYERPAGADKATFEALRRAKSELEFPSQVTGVYHDPDGMALFKYRQEQKRKAAQAS